MADYTIPQGTVPWDAQMNANLTDVNTRLTTGETTNAAQAAAISTNTNNIATNTSNITALQASDATQNANISTNTGNITTLQGQMSTANTNIATNTANIATNTSNIATNTTNITTLQGQMTTVTNTANQAVPRDTLVVSVKDHGALGDGTTDDTSAINAAVGSLPAAGGTLFFPPGNYLLNGSSTITLSKPITVKGASPVASSIRIGSSFTGTEAFTVTSDDVVFEGIEIRGNSSTVTSNPVASAISTTNGSKSLRILNTTIQFINAYAVKVFANSSSTIHGGMIANSKIQSCAGGVYIKGDNASGNVAANWEISNLFTRFLGVNSGGSANLDGIRIEDAWDVLVQNTFTWMNASTGGTGSSFRVIGNCAATFVVNLDALGPTTSTSGNVSLEANANGSPQNVQITGGVIQQGNVGLNIAGATTQVRVGSVRFINNQTHGATVSTSGPAVYFDSVFFSGNGAGATGTNYDLNWSGTTTGFVTNCRFASAIVAVNNAGVQQSINIAAAQNVRFFNADFQGLGQAQANWFTNLPAYATTNNVSNQRFAFLTDVDFNYATGPGRVAIQPFAAGNNCLSLNVQGTDTNDRFRLTGDGAINIGPGNAARDTQWGRQGVANIGTTNSDITINLAGKTLKVQSGTNAKAGTAAAMTAGSVTVSTTAVTANSVIVASLKTAGGTVGAPFVSAVTPGTSFTLKSTSGTDTSVYNWIILEVI